MSGPQSQDHDISLTSEKSDRSRASTLDEPSQILDNFLKTRAQAPGPSTVLGKHGSTPKIFTLSLETIQSILRHFLVAPIPLILHPDASTPIAYHSHVQPSLLQVCHQFYHLGLPIIYAENTITTSTPATSYHFDAHLAELHGKHRQLIRKVKLEIDWADKLWAKFPLIASSLAEIRSLQKLEIFLVEKEVVCEGESGTSMCKCGMVRGSSRKGKAAEIMLKVEKKMFKELVLGFKALRVFRLKGFQDEMFAKGLENLVQGGGKS
ncbi:hypothetical protein MMC28_002236 [Mycoblastus sanguinarius]|nr:hypothetical protein [Mycoblastus sanguinarius]